MDDNYKKRSIDCPYCFEGNVSQDKCNKCGEIVRIRSGIPSVIRKGTGDKFADKLEVLATVENKPFDDVLAEVRDDYLDGSVVDRFFKTRTVNWRVLVEPHLSGRGLIIGNHDEKVGILLSELLNETYTVDTSLVRLRAQTAVANTSGRNVNPLHAEVGDLPFPPNSFGVIVIQCRASEIKNYLSQLKKHVTAEGTILLLVDGWPRESGITELVGLGGSPNDLLDRLQSTLYGHSFGIKKLLRNAGLSPSKQYALLSTNCHENERLFEAQSEAALDWLLHGSSKTANSFPFLFAKIFSQMARKSGFLEQCYPRYLFVCEQNSESSVDSSENIFSENNILISGKNRSTILEFDGNNIKYIQKVPNSQRQGILNERAEAVIENINETTFNTLPTGEVRNSAFGPIRVEQPVSGTPLDETLELTPESIDNHLDTIFDWLCEFQRLTMTEMVEKKHSDIEHELIMESVGLTNPPVSNCNIEIVQTSSHGDLFGSNIYLNHGSVSSVIDWEWGKVKSNPIIDPGFFLLQMAELIEEQFEEGFVELFIRDNEYSQIVYTHINDYCSEMSIKPQTFAIYLPISYINRSKDDLKINKRLDIDWPSRVQYVWDHQATIQSRINSMKVDK